VVGKVDQKRMVRRRDLQVIGRWASESGRGDVELM